MLVLNFVRFYFGNVLNIIILVSEHLRLDMYDLDLTLLEVSQMCILFHTI